MFKLSIFFTLALVFLLVDQAEAHGYQTSQFLGGQNYSGYLPFADPYASPAPKRVVRPIPGDGPVTALDSPTIACNVGGDKAASLTADVPAGSSVKFQWTNWPTDHIGPVATWMGSCNGACTDVDLTKVKFFKIDESGYDASSKQWGSQKLMAQGNSWQSTVPASLAPGEYLLRHEIIALHSAGAAQVYPSCSQVKVTGNGNQTPSSSDVVDITKVYTNSAFPDIWEDFGTFTMPGPQVFGGGSADSAPSSPASNSTSASPTTTTSATTTGSAPTSSQATSTSASTSSTSSTTPTSRSSSFVSAPIASATGRCRRSKMVKRHHRHDSLAKRGH